jgi:hypothetical protein
MKTFYLLLSAIFVVTSCRDFNKKDNKNFEQDSISVLLDTANKTEEFIFLGEKVGRKENFETPILVTNDNIEKLYCKYDVSKVLVNENTVYYLIKSKKIYNDARFLSRIVKITNNKQEKAITFYDYTLFYIDFIEKNKLLIGLNSLGYSNPNFPSCFCGKILILNENLETIFMKQFQYQDYEYTYIDTLYQTKEGFYSEIINISFDPDDYFLYKAYFDKSGKMLKSSKEKKLIEK